MYKLRPYQNDGAEKVFQAWREGYRNVLLVLPTGAGKTVTFSYIASVLAVLGKGAELTGQPYTHLPTAILVHRKELVSQICITLARAGIFHNIIAPQKVIGGIMAAERRLIGRQFYDYNASVTVLSVDTLNKRINRHRKWADTIKLWITDEAAHLLRDNKWGEAVGHFPNAIGLGVTATPERLDKKGLGAHADGVFHTMVLGPSTRWLIQNGFLSKYRIVVPKGDFKEHLKRATSGSDYSKDAMMQASMKSHIIGDVVKNYKLHAMGKQTILFATDIHTAMKMEEAFKAEGISAITLTSETDDSDRIQGVIDFQEGRIRVLINVDLFDEGFDVPGVECVIMARPTMSVSKYLQVCGRGLRTAEGKEYAIIIDHVGNIVEHGLPDDRRVWTLDRIIRRGDKKNLIRICKNVTCNAPYDRMLSICPYCGEEDKPAPRSAGGSLRKTLKEVDGDLVLLDPNDIRELEAEAFLEDPARTGERVSRAAGAAAGMKAMQNQKDRIEAANQLAVVIAKWAGLMKRHGLTDRQIHKRFYITYDMTITQALSVPKADMVNLMEELKYEIGPYE